MLYNVGTIMKHLTSITISLLFCGGAIASVAALSNNVSASGNTSLKPPVPPAAVGTSLTIVPAEGFNLKLDRVWLRGEDKPRGAVVKPRVKAHNWFAGTFKNLPTSHPFTIQVAMKGNDTPGNRANVAKWQGLAPVMTYADPGNYESYIGFQKNAQGRWVSGDPFATAEDRLAGNGPVPEQYLMPAPLARQFLSADGKYWWPWRVIERATADIRTNVFSIRHQFAAPTATVAMRVPYTYDFLQKFLDRLEDARLPGVAIDTIGTTAEGRRLQIIRVEDQKSSLPLPQRKTVLVIAREHATEHASSWAVHGMLLKLIEGSRQARQLRANTTWMLIPIQDPDGSAHSQFDRLTDQFRKPHGAITAIPPEVFAYTRYFRDYVNRGRTIDVALSLHNVEAREAPNISSPFVHQPYRNAVLNFNRSLFDRLRAAGYEAGRPQPAALGGSPFRLYGWCALHFGTLDIAYEVNDQYPQKRLTLARLQQIGALMAQQLVEWGKSKAGQQQHRQARAVLKKRAQERAAYFARVKTDSPHRPIFDLLVLAY